MKVKISDVDKMIKEEFQKMMEKKKLSTRLSQINESINEMNAEDKSLEEVEAGEKTHVASHAWTGEKNGDVKWEPKFEKKGSALKEDGIEGMEPEVDAEVKPEMGEFEAKFAEIGRAIDAKMSAESGEVAASIEAPVSDEVNSDDDFEEVEVDGDGGENEIKVSDGEEGASDASSEEVDETYEEGVKEVTESVEEPLEGHSVAQEADADKVNDNMEKDNHVKEGELKSGAVIVEATKPSTKNIFTEGLDDKKKSSLLEEMKRMKKFAGLSRDEE